MNWTRDRHITLGGPPALTWPAAAFLAVTAIVTIVRAAVEFDKGIWLIAFLFLVGFVAQMLLALGQSGLRPEGTPERTVRFEATLWNLGAVLVPLSTMAGAKAGVIIGSFALVGALVAFGRSALDATRGTQPLWGFYWAFILFMGVSVLTGVGLSWSEPWL